MSKPLAPAAIRLDIADASLERGGRMLLSGLSVSLAAGEALLVTGPNGAGKTSLLRAIAGLLPLARGRIAFSDGDEIDVPAGARAHYLGHADGLKNALTALENLVFWSAILGAMADAAAVRQALAHLGLSHIADLPVAYLSAGQRRRVALARLLTATRPLWLLDEPTTALDAAAQERFHALMRRHLDAGGMLIAATHAPLELNGARELRLGQTA